MHGIHPPLTPPVHASGGSSTREGKVNLARNSRPVTRNSQPVTRNPFTSTPNPEEASSIIDSHLLTRPV
jgi:hypothetical protein